jgi:hypothetical protein
VRILTVQPKQVKGIKYRLAPAEEELVELADFKVSTYSRTVLSYFIENPCLDVLYRVGGKDLQSSLYCPLVVSPTILPAFGAG